MQVRIPEVGPGTVQQVQSWSWSAKVGPEDRGESSDERVTVQQRFLEVCISKGMKMAR